MRKQRLIFEPLETRYAPATLVNPTTLTYQDIDGDKVTVSFSKPVLSAANVNDVFQFNSGAGAVNGNNTTKEQLRRIDLTVADNPAGTSVSVVSTAANGGDGFANAGFINSTNQPLGAVSVDGDLGQIDAGDESALGVAVASFTVRSMGLFGVTTQGAGGSLKCDIYGHMGPMLIKRDMVGTNWDLGGMADAKVASFTVGGSVIGDSGDDSGKFKTADGAIGPIVIKGDLVGGAGARSGLIHTEGDTAGLTIGGSIIGSVGTQSGAFKCDAGIGFVKIGRDVVGGEGANSGTINVEDRIGSLTIKGTLRGGLGNVSGTLEGTDIGKVLIGGSMVGGKGQESGMLYADGSGTAGPITIRGSLLGGEGDSSGAIFANANAASILIGGSIIGGTRSEAGSISAPNGRIGTVTIQGSLVGGSIATGVGGTLSDTGTISAERLGNVAIGGSVIAGVDNSSTGSLRRSGAIVASKEITSVAIGGSVLGQILSRVQISAVGQDNPSPTTDLAIGKISIGGSVQFADILAGYDQDQNALNPDASIGSVSVGGDWVASDLVAGAQIGADDDFGTADDALISGGTNTSRVARIASVLIKGVAIGSPTILSDAFGIVAEQIGSLKIGLVTGPLAVGPSNDLTPLPLGSGTDFNVREV